MNGMTSLLFQEVEGRIEEVANSLKNSIKEKDRGGPSLNAFLSFAQCVHRTQTFPLLSICVRPQSLLLLWRRLAQRSVLT